MIPATITRKMLAAAISFIACCLLFSCKKTDNISSPELPADFSKKITASVSGFVTNEFNAPVAGASVQYGESFYTTDKYGYFDIKNATVTENAGVVTVKMPGYFNGIKTCIAKTGKSNFCRIKLLPKTSAGSVDAAAGGDVSLPNGLKVTLPAAGIVNASTGASYSGAVTVFSSWINPVADDINETMPGDLRALTTNGALRSLTSFGMAAVELTGSSGQLLQIATGKKATLTFPLPNTVAADAPAAIPLWYFDETRGLWIEEGTAIKTGGTYVGEVKHFTVWNVDIPNATVPVSFTITDSASNPLTGARVEITPLTNNVWGHISGYTDNTGFAQVPVPANGTYRLTVFSDYCTAAFAYTKDFSVTTGDINLGNIVLGGGFTATITGTATDCNNNPLVNGRIVLKNGWVYDVVITNSDGAFSFTNATCSDSIQLNITPEDLSLHQEGPSTNYTIHPGVNNIGNLQACGTNTNVYLDIVINGRHFVSINDGELNAGRSQGMPADSIYTSVRGYFYEVVNNQVDLNRGFLTWFTIFSSGNPNMHHYVYEMITFRMNDTVMITNGNAKLCPAAYINNISDYSGCIPSTITEFGNVAEYVAGNFSGVFYEGNGGGTQYGAPPDLSRPFNVSCSFRVKRFN